MVEMYIPHFTKQHKLLKEAGICNYSIYLCGNDLFGYYECQNGIKYAQYYQNNSEIVKTTPTADSGSLLFLFKRHS